MGSIIFALIVLMCAVLFIGIGIHAMKRKTPMFFWAGKRVKNEDITDIKSYNKENGVMWILFGVFYILFSILALLTDSKLVGLFFAISSIIGIIVLMMVYQKIYNKYRA